MDVTIYPEPNPAITEILVGAPLRRVVEERANMAMLLYQAKVAKRSGALAGSAYAHTEIAPVLKGEPRWVGVMSVGRGLDYGLPHEFGRGDHPGSIHDLDSGHDIVQVAADDLNFVLAELHAW